MHVRQLQQAAGAQTHASPFSFLCAAPGAFLEGSPSLGALREAFGRPGIPYPCISLALLIAVRAVQKGGVKVQVWGFHFGRITIISTSFSAQHSDGRSLLFRVSAVRGAKDKDSDVHFHSSAVSERLPLPGARECTSQLRPSPLLASRIPFIS